MRALTDLEFAAAEAQTADENADGAPPQAAIRIDVDVDGLEPSSTSAATGQTVTTAQSDVMQPRLILGPSPQPSHAGSRGASPTAATTAAAPAARQEQGRTLLHQTVPQPHVDDVAHRVGGRRQESASAAANRPAGRRHTTASRPEKSRSERAGGEEAHSSITEQHGASETGCMNPSCLRRWALHATLPVQAWHTVARLHMIAVFRQQGFTRALYCLQSCGRPLTVQPSRRLMMPRGIATWPGRMRPTCTLTTSASASTQMRPAGRSSWTTLCRCVSPLASHACVHVDRGCCRFACLIGGNPDL